MKHPMFVFSLALFFLASFNGPISDYPTKGRFPAGEETIDFVKGRLEKDGDDFYIVNLKQRLKILTNGKIKKSLPSLHAPSFVTQSNGVPYAFEFKGKVMDDEEFILDEVPTNIPGSQALTGKLLYSEMDNEYYIGDTQVSFGYTKELNGYRFDEVSKKSFIGQEVLAEGDYNEEGILIMQALTPTNLFDADAPKKMPQRYSQSLKELGPKKFVQKEMIKNKNSRSSDSFRAVLYKKKDSEVKPGDTALLITLSGRQGDSFGSVNGHFVAGLGEVRQDMTLRAEVSNAYVTNGKDILSGNTSLTNYFSHIVQGQNNYRPTYTLIAYGVDQKKLKQFRDALEESHIEFRTKKLDITAQFNCTTETVKALKDADIKGSYFQADNFGTRMVTGILGFRFWSDNTRTLHYALGNDASRYHPTKAFNSFTNAFLKKKYQKKYGIKRLDYVFYSQIPSNRPVGGISLGKTTKAPKFKKLYDKYEVEKDTKLSPEELRPLLEEILPEIPY